jgi:phosphoribosyl-AMP cyclohydrolase
MIMNILEEGTDLNLDFNKLLSAAKCRTGLIPVAIQNIDTKEVILIAYTNKQAFYECLKRRILILWSSSRNELWEKGKTSGNQFKLIEAYVNCEQNSLLDKVRPAAGGICHTKNSSGKPRDCFYRRINLDTLRLENTNP